MQRFTHLPPNVRARAIIIGGAALVLAALFVMLRPPPVAVESALVDRGLLQYYVSGEGTTRVKERYVVSATVAGRLRRVDWMENDKIVSGQVITRIDPLPVLSSIAQDEARLGEIQSNLAGVNTLRPKAETIAQARSRVDAAQADQRTAAAKLIEARNQYEQAVRDRGRAHKLFAGGYVPQADVEQADLTASMRRSDLDAATLGKQAADARLAEAQQAVGETVAKVSDPDYLIGVYNAQIASTQAELRKLRSDASQTVLRSPVSGRVLRVLQKSEQFVAAGTPIMEIGDPTGIELVIQMLSTDAIDIRPGNGISVDDGSSTYRYTGRVRYVEPSAFTKISALGVEEQRVNVIGDFTGPHAGFGDAYRIEARVITWQSPDALRVPAAALFRCENDWCVFTVEGGRARQRRVSVDHIGADAAQVVGGLSEGTRVILHPTDRIADGTRVSAR